MIRKISGAFTGGVLGALADSIGIWLLGKLGITALVGVTLKPAFTMPWLYPRMIWGGLWMLLLMLPFWKNRTFFRGCFFSLFPSAMVLFVTFPQMGKGFLGTGFGIMTPVMVIGLNLIYGIIAAYWYKSNVH